MQWNEGYSVGVPLIDAQHRELFARVHQLRQALIGGDRAEVGRLLEFLGAYVVEHFRTEQREMVRTGFPQYALHKAAHDCFVRDFQALAAEYVKTGATPRLILEVNGAVRDWIVQHILGMDQRLGKHLAAARGESARR